MQRIKRISIYMCAFLIFLIIALPIYHHATRHFFERRDQQPYPTVLPG